MLQAQLDALPVMLSPSANIVSRYAMTQRRRKKAYLRSEELEQLRVACDHFAEAYDETSFDDLIKRRQ